ncbi:HlyD family secretion protein [Desulfurobacterium crinifex]
MKRFTLTKKLKEKASAPIPTEIERPTERKEPPLRKWFFRSFLLIIFLGIVYIVFKDVIFVEIKGLVKPEKITVKAPFDGTFIAFASIGDVVEKDHLIGKIYNSKVESGIKSLQETLKLLLSWEDRLKEENSLRRKLEKLTLSTRTYSLSDPITLRKELRSLYREREKLVEMAADTEERLKKLKALVEIGAATELEVEKEKEKLIKLKREIDRVNSKTAQIEGKLKKAKELEKLIKSLKGSPSPLITSLSSIDFQIDRVKQKINELSSSVALSLIKFPFKVKVSQIATTGSYLSKGDNVVTVFNMNNYFVEAYFPPKEAKKIHIGDRVKVLLPTGEKLEGVVEAFEPNLILKPNVLVGPLEKRTLVLPVKIKLINQEGRSIVYENMPVTVLLGG